MLSSFLYYTFAGFHFEVFCNSRQLGQLTPNTLSALTYETNIPLSRILDIHPPKV